MSEAERTEVGSAQFTETNESIDPQQIESCESRDVCNNKSEFDLVFDSSNENILSFQDGVVVERSVYCEGVANWGVGEGLNPVQGVGEGFQMFGMEGQSFGQIEMGDDVSDGGVDLGQGDGVGKVDDAREELPVSGGESVANWGVGEGFQMLGTEIQGFRQTGMENFALNSEIDVGQGDGVGKVDDAREELPVGGGESVANWGVGEGVQMRDMEGQGFGENGMGNVASDSGIDLGQGGCVGKVDDVREELPVGGGESVSCKPVEEGVSGGIGGNEEVAGSSLGGVNSVGEVPLMDRSESGQEARIVGGEDVEMQGGGLDAGKCENQTIEEVLSVGEGLQMLDSEFQGFGQTEMGNVALNSNVDVGQGEGVGKVDDAQEELPVGGGESVSCEPMEEGGRGAIGANDEVPGSSLGGLGSVGEVPCMDGVESAQEAGIVGDGDVKEMPEEISDAGIVGGGDVKERPGERLDVGIVGGGDVKEIPGESLEAGKCENQTIGEVQVGSWESICELAKQSEESARLVQSVNEPNTVCLSPNQISGDRAVEFCNGNLDGFVNRPIDTSNLEYMPSEKMADGARFEHASENLVAGSYASVLIEQPEGEPDDGANEEQTADFKNDVNGLSAMSFEQKPVAEDTVEIRDDNSAACDEKAVLNEQSRVSPVKTGGGVYVIVQAIPVDTNEMFRSGRKPVNTSAVKPLVSSTRVLRGRSQEKPLVSTTRVLRGRSQEEPVAPEPIVTVENTSGSTAGRRGKKKKTDIEGKSYDEFSRMRKQVRYMLHRIKYARNLLEAYSSEGWRGQSIDKLRPEKELQRAKADINRSKLKIRELFQRLDSMAAEGKFPESLFDDEGLIDSEDIFCAKCGSKDLPTGNDIILCDGVCDRGFHQYCLEPPLRTEEIPPGDEGWLCPACDCKIDCADLLNDSQGTKLSIEDSWEKVFPEAVAAMAGHEQDDLLGLPSDDSDDNDYDPDGPNDDVKVEGSEGSSDASDSNDSDSSDFSSASEDLGAVRADEQYERLPSDDSEDDDYDPDAANVNMENENGNSGSDFSSASGENVGDDGTSDKDEADVPSHVDQDLGDSVPHSSRRKVERLDYKKLFDETYGNAPSDSSDDEEWNSGEKNISGSVDGTSPAATSRRRGRRKQNNQAANCSVPELERTSLETSNEVTPRRGRSKLNKQAAHGSPAELETTPKDTCSGGKSRKRAPYNKLSEAITQRLYESFKENQYPDGPTQEKLAEELGLTKKRVGKWFGNARWSLTHHPAKMEATIAKVLPHGGAPQNVACNGAKSDVANIHTAVPQDGGANSAILNMTENITTPPKTRKRKKNDTDEPLLHASKEEDSVTPRKTRSRKKNDTDELLHASKTENTRADQSQENGEGDQLKTPEAPQGRVLRKRKRSGA